MTFTIIFVALFVWLVFLFVTVQSGTTIGMFVKFVNFVLAVVCLIALALTRGWISRL